MNEFFNEYGLLNSKPNEGVAENSPLWTWEYLLMNWNDDLYARLYDFVSNCSTDTEGLYNQRPFKNGTKDDYMSPDQLIPFAIVLHRREGLQSVWNYLKKHCLTYDNLTGKTNFRRTMQPSVVLFILCLLDKKWPKPLLALSMMYSCISKPEETSGKIKAWTMFKTLKMNKTEKICNYIVSKRSKFKDWEGIFLEYFKEENHPIRQYIIKNGLK